MRILLLGNGDNFGARFYSWFLKNDIVSTLFRISADENHVRGNPTFYLSEEQLINNSNVKLIDFNTKEIRNISLFGGTIIKNINKNFDVVIVAGGIHALLFSRKIKIPKIFIPVGYELHTWANLYRGIPDFKEVICNFRKTKRDYFYAWLTRSSLRHLTRINDWFPYTISVLKSLKLQDKVEYMAVGEDIEKNRELINQDLYLKLINKIRQSNKIFLWFSRINFSDPKAANYKGTDLFIKALEHMNEEMKSKKLIVFMGKHGNDISALENILKDSTISSFINWVPHLDYPDLITYLSLPNTVLFTDFGNVNSGISGIGRDGYCLGVPMVNSTIDEIMINQYGASGPRLFANNVETIVKQMKFLMQLSDNEFVNLKQKTEQYAKEYINQDVFVKRIINQCEKVIS